MSAEPRINRIHRLLDRADQSLRRVPIPVYGVRSNRLPALVGTAFLLRINTRTFIVTAAHVLDKRGDTGLRLPGKEGLQPWNMKMYRTRVPSPRRPDKFDIAFNEVPPTILAGLSRYEVVDVKRLDQNHRQSPSTMYSFMGYPASMNKPQLKTKTLEPTIQPYHVVTLKEDEYERVGLNTSSHIAVQFDAPNTRYPDGVVRTPPNPQGISGGPVWSLGTLWAIDRKVSRPKIVGIGIEHQRSPERLEASRIGFVLAGIAEHFPEVRDAIPSSEFLHVKVTQE